MAKKQKKSNNKLLYILLGVVGILIVLAVVGKKQGWVGKEKEIEVEISKVSYETIIEKVSASGTVQPVVEIKISPEVSGEIIELRVEEGDSVKKGDFLLKIRPDNFISALERANANLSQQKANFYGANARLNTAKASFMRSELEYNRQKKLIDENIISDSDFELADANYKIATQDLESAKQSVEAAKYIVQSAEATVDEAKKNLKLTTITASMTGIVSKLDVEEGETVLGTSQFQGTEMLRIADLGKMEVRVDVNENDIIRISRGDTAIIDVDSYSYMDKEFRGVVTQIANTANNKVSADAVTEFEVRIRILNESYKDLMEEMNLAYPFRPGMTASVDIITDVKADILTVELASVTTRKPGSINKKKENGDNSDTENEDDNSETETTISDMDEAEEVVFVVVDGKAVKKVVKTGISDFKRIEILSGLDEGQEVISGPFLAVSKRLNDGDPIKPMEKNDKKEQNDAKDDN